MSLASAKATRRPGVDAESSCTHDGDPFFRTPTFLDLVIASLGLGRQRHWSTGAVQASGMARAGLHGVRLR